MYYDKVKGLYREQITINGKRKVVSAKTKKECKLKLLSLQAESVAIPTFEKVAKKWECDVLEQMKSGTVRTYAPALRRAVQEFGSVPVNTITPHKIKTYLMSLQMAYKTTATYRTVISLVLDYAITDFNVVMYNPCGAVKIPTSLPRNARQPLTEGERNAILESDPTEFQLAYLIMMTGMRCGEALGLQMKDIDMNGNLIHVTKQITHNGNKPVISELKTESSDRYIPLLPPLKKRIAELKLCPENYIVSGDNPLTKSALDKRWKKWCKAHGVDIDRHSIRHEFCTLCFECGIDVKTLQSILGHSNFSTTMNIYTHVRERQLQDAADKLTEFFA